MNFGKLGQPRITIDIDTTEGTYSVDFEHCSVPVAYAVLRNVVERIESGEFMNDEGVEIEDERGNKVSGDEAKRVVRELKEQLDSCSDSASSGSEGGRVVKIVTDNPGGSKSN